MKPLTVYLLFLLLLNFSPAFCQYDSLKGGGIYASDFIIDAIPRNITYYMPARYGNKETYPLLIVLHNDSSSAKKVIKMYGNNIHAKADTADCVVMYPDAIGGHWHSKINGNSSVKDSVNDVSFIGLMLDFFIQQYNCDANRIYLLGIGNGGNMCYRLNCERPGKFTAMAAINATADATNMQNCSVKGTTPVPALQSEGDIKAGIGRAYDFLLAHTKAK